MPRTDPASRETAAPAIDQAAAGLRDLLERVADLARDPLERMIAGSVHALRGGGKLLFAGNGGSAAQCQHLATELVGRFALDRAPHAAIALTTDSSFLTACANDYGFVDVFARQVEALGQPGDVLFALSTGGRSPNVLKAIEAARTGGLKIYGLTGAGGTGLAERCDEAILVPHPDPARIQEVHLFLGHLLCGGIEERLAEP